MEVVMFALSGFSSVFLTPCEKCIDSFAEYCDYWCADRSTTSVTFDGAGTAHQCPGVPPPVN